MISNIQMQQSVPQSPHPNLNIFPQGTHQPYSHRAQNHVTYVSNHEQIPQLHHQQQHDIFGSGSVQQHLHQVYAPQHQQPGLEQTLQFPVSMVPPRALVYQQQVQAYPYPEPPVYQPISQTLQYNEGPLQQPLVAPQHTRIVHLQQYPHRESSCSDSQSGSSVGSSYPSALRSPGYRRLYNDHNLRKQPTIMPLSTQCYPFSQVINRGLFHSNGTPPFSFNAQGSSIPSDMKCGNNQLTERTVPSVIPIQPQLKPVTTSSNLNINIAPKQQTSTNSVLNRTERGG